MPKNFRTIRQKRSDREERNSPQVTAAKSSDLCDPVKRRKEFLDCYGIFFKLSKGHGSLLFKLGFFPKIFGFHQVLNLVNIPTSALTLRKVSHSGD